MNENCVICNNPDTSVGCHGLKDGEVVSEYFCDKCYGFVKQGRREEMEEKHETLRNDSIYNKLT